MEREGEREVGGRAVCRSLVQAETGWEREGK